MSIAETVLEKALDFAIGQIAQRVPSDMLSFALRTVTPQLASMAQLEKWDAEARLHVMATIDEGLRAIDL